MNRARLGSVFALALLLLPPASVAAKWPVEVLRDQCTGLTPVITSQPRSQTITVGQQATLDVTASGLEPFQYQWWHMGFMTVYPISGATSRSYTTPPLTSDQEYSVVVSNDCGSVTSEVAIITVVACTPPVITRHPASTSIPRGSSATLSAAATGSSPLTFQWYRGPSGDASNPISGATGSSYATGALNAPSTSFWVRVTNGCGRADSAAAVVTTVCTAPAAPMIQAPGSVASGQTFDVEFSLDTPVANYELQEAAVETFAGAVTFTTTAKKLSFTKSVDASTRFFYRARGIATCDAVPGPFSPTAEVTVAPAPNGNDLDPNVSLPEGSRRPVTFTYRLSPPSSGSGAFTASTDRSWLQVTPAGGTIPPAGLDLSVEADPSALSPGTSTGTLIITAPGASSNGARLTASSGGSTNVPLSVSLVTPVSPRPRSADTQDAFVIPVVGHAEGANNSTFLSDVRIFNSLASQAVNYRVTFTPSGSDGSSSQQTTITVSPQQTLALNDIVKTWFGLGAMPNESALGVLEIRPLGAQAGTAFLATAASSRTYNITPNGTFGQFIPAIPLASFIAAPAGGVVETISLQQIAESDGYRTNFGIVEGSGGFAHVVVRIYSSAGTLLKEVTIDLQPFEHRQINRFLQQNGIASLSDGRMEIQVASGSGRVTAYASVLDNRTNDPLLVLPVVTRNVSARHYTLPGVADFNNASASWRTDLRIFNGGPAPASVTISFQAFRANGLLPPAVNRQVTIPSRAVMAYDSVLQSLFGLTNILGGIHVTTSTASSLVVTGRTYDLKPSGTYGQFIPAVSNEEGAGLGDAPLQLLQVEESDRFRTNVGIAEISGNPVVVELTVHAPDLLAFPRKEIALAANEFVQINRLLEELHVHTAYNARVRVKVIGGNGRVTAYASVIDNLTQDPTYIPAQ